MLLLPRSFKYKKKQKGKVFNKIDNIIAFKNIQFGTLSLISTSHSRITSKQINSICLAINKVIKKVGVLKLNIFPHNPITKKPIEIRMGKGKGHVDHWVFNLKAGFEICRIQSLYLTQAYKALKNAQIRLPVKTKISFN